MAGKGTAGYLSEITIDGVSIACDSISPSISFDEAETTEFGDDAESQILTVQRAELGISGTYRPGSGAGEDAGQEDLEDAFFARTHPLVIVYKPQGSVTGKPVYTFNAHVTSFTPSTSATDKVTFESSLRLNDGAAVVKTLEP